VYDSFGNRTEAMSADFRFGYTGRELDTETGLYYYRARYYDAAVGRFISEDPIGFSAGDTNLYRYVFNNATNYTDPSGKLIFAPLLAWAATAAVAGVVGAISGAGFGFGMGQSAVWPKTLTMMICPLIHLVVLSNMVLKVLSKVPNLVLEYV
jgi:RHS repeat-associated protein